MTARMKIAILDDYQDVATSFADWDSLNAEIVVFTNHAGQLRDRELSGSFQRKGQMADWIFQGSPREHDLDARIAASPGQWWGTPRYRDRMAVGDRVWVQVTGPHHPGIYYVATIVSATYEHPLQPGEPGYARWRTDIRVDYRIRPPLLRSELLGDATLGSFRPFHGF
jgi:hypothetical protein